MNLNLIFPFSFFAESVRFAVCFTFFQSAAASKVSTDRLLVPEMAEGDCMDGIFNAFSLLPVGYIFRCPLVGFS